MTPQPKSRTVGCWLVLDNKGDTWRVQCANPECGAVKNYSRNLLTGFVTPRCSKCGGKVPSKPVEASKPPVAAVVPVQVVASVLTPVLTPRSTKPALIGKRPDSDMEADRVAQPKAVKEPKPPKPPKPVREPKAKPVKEPKPPKPPKELRVRKHRVRASRAVPGARAKLVPVKYLPGEEYGTLTVLREGTRRGRNRMIVCLCSWCGRQWELAITSVRNAPEYCACSNRHLQKNSDSAEKERMAAERKAKRQAYLAARALDTLDKLIHHLRRRLGQAEARRKKMLA